MNLQKFIPIIAKCSQGQLRKGVGVGGDYLLLNFFDIKCTNNAIVIPNESFNTTQGYKSLYNICTNTAYPLVLGGDHSIGTSTVLSSINKYKNNLSVIWIDAHADINTYEASKSKNRHGTPLASCVGLEKVWFDESITTKLDFNKLFYVGIRDLDDFEKDVINKYNIKVFTPEEAVEYIKNTSDKIHISFDVDAIDPMFLDSTGTTASNGLTNNDVKNIISQANNSNKLIALDVVEFNPELGDVIKSVKYLESIFN